MLRSRSGRATLAGASLIASLFFGFVCIALAADKKKPSPTATPKKGEFNPSNLPVPIGHEVKGLVLPEFNIQGQMIGRVEAGSAVRTDEIHVLFKGIKLTTFNETNQPDLEIEMSDSVLDLKTRIVTSDHRTFVRRPDFNIQGDKFQFDTIAHIGTMTGNVKMVIQGKEHFHPAENKNE